MLLRKIKAIKMKKIYLIFFMNLNFVCYCQYDLEVTQKTNKKIENQKNEFENLYDCSFIPLFQYKVGMKFYFPKINKESSSRLSYYSYKKIVIDKKNRITKSDIVYTDIENKLFEIINIKEETNYSITHTVFWLKEIGSDFTIQHEVIYSLSELEKQYKNEDEIFRQLTELEDAIYIEEIDKFKDKYLNSYFYANFPINGIKFQKVKITKIGAGTAIFPIRAIVETETNDIETKDFNTCGTNVSPVITRKTRFANYFFIENPKTKYNISDEKWNSIIQSKIKVGFNKTELILAWDEPRKINTTLTNNVETEQYVYKDQYVYLTNNIITSIQSSE